MSQNDEWGPWIMHDGGDCPLQNGTIVQAKTADNMVFQGRVDHTIDLPKYVVNSWIWAECEAAKRPEWRVIRYRVRRPKGLTILEEIAANPPQEPIGKPAPDLVPA